MAAEPMVLDLFSEFTQLRQRGMNRDDAWYTVLELAERQQLRKAEVKRLLILAKGWEQREGYHYRQLGKPTLETTSVSASVIKPIHSPSTLDQTALYSPEEQPVAPSSGTQPLPGFPKTGAASYFGSESVLLLYFQDCSTPLQVRFTPGQEILIGRITANTAMSPDIDLEQVRSGVYGVSRLHAALTQRDHTLLIADLGSRNGTRVNQQALYPHEIRVLYDQDEVWFAQLPCKVRFWYPGQP